MSGSPCLCRIRDGTHLRHTLQAGPGLVVWENGGTL
jgi:hypothetical protein